MVRELSKLKKFISLRILPSARVLEPEVMDDSWEEAVEV